MGRIDETAFAASEPYELIEVFADSLSFKDCGDVVRITGFAIVHQAGRAASHQIVLRQVVPKAAFRRFVNTAAFDLCDQASGLPS